jgi:hypothetical protein
MEEAVYVLQGLEFSSAELTRSSFPLSSLSSSSDLAKDPDVDVVMILTADEYHVSRVGVESRFVTRLTALFGRRPSRLRPLTTARLSSLRSL